MGSFGENLKKEREARGISLQEISEHTKIGVRLLRAIEEERFDQLPGGIFNKSFVRHYAGYLGLDQDRVIAEYLAVAGTGREATPHPGMTPPEGKIPLRAAGYLRITLTAVALGAAVAGIAYALYRITDRTPASVPPATVASPAPRSLSSGPSAGAESVPADTLGAGTQDASAPSGPLTQTPLEKAPALAAAILEKRQGQAPDPEVATGPLWLRIDALSTVWLSISADGENQWQGNLQPQQTRQVQAEEVIQLTVGNAGGVALTLNGKALPPLGAPGEVKRLTISANGLSKPTP